MESWHQCMASECGRRASDDHVRCISCTAHLKRQALAVVKEIRSNAVVAYVGRSNSPERRLLQHFTGQGVSKTVRKHPQQRDRLSVIHWTGSWREAAMVEDHLIKHSSAKPGLADLLNSPAEGWGRFSGPWNCVYVNCWHGLTLSSALDYENRGPRGRSLLILMIAVRDSILK
jgi:predicted GIY-YIG superfamily endonuclease